MGEPQTILTPPTASQMRAIESAEVTRECLLSMSRAASKLKSRISNTRMDIVTLAHKLQLPSKHLSSLTSLDPIIPSAYHFGQIIVVKRTARNGHNYRRHPLMVVLLPGQSCGDGPRGLFASTPSAVYLGNFIPSCEAADKGSDRALYVESTLDVFAQSFVEGPIHDHVYGDHESIIVLAKLCHYHYKL